MCTREICVRQDLRWQSKQVGGDYPAMRRPLKLYHGSFVLHVLSYLTTDQKVVREAHVWSKLDHKNVLPLIGITTDFDVSISLVSKWMTIGTAHDYVQDRSVDPRPLVGSDTSCLQPTYP